MVFRSLREAIGLAGRREVVGSSPAGGIVESGRRRLLMRTIECVVCGQEAVKTGRKQVTCKSRECRLKRRSELRKQQRRADREKNPKSCVWCLQPITEIGKRSYHPECRALKNAERVSEYRRTHAPAAGPKKPRKYKGRVTCRYCKLRVKRTGAGQLTCCSRECRNARKAELKRNASGLERRMREAFEKKAKAALKVQVTNPDRYFVAPS